MISDFEKGYQANKQMFIRFWRKGCGFISRSNQYFEGDSMQTRYSTIRAAMDVEGVDHVLSAMLKGDVKEKHLVLIAWIFKNKVVCEGLRLDAIINRQNSPKPI